MARFNAKVVSKTKTVNKAGGKAYKESTKLELVSTLLTSFLDDKYYESSSQTQARLIQIIAGLPDKFFVAQAICYARTKFGMRSVSHLGIAEIARTVKGEEWVKHFIDKSIYRVDDVTEVVAYYLSKYKKPLPNSLKKGLGLALGRFDEYGFAKYQGKDKEVSLVDVVNMIHPKPTEKNKKALKALIEGTLKPAETWEVELTRAGQSAESVEDKAELKSEAWKKLISEGKLTYFAALRNLRNIIEQCPEMIDDVCNIITNEAYIKKSLVMPFRYDTAYQAIEVLPTNKVTRLALSAVNKAVDISCQNVPKLEGETLVAIDVSGSMGGRCADIALLFGAILFKSNNCDIITFDNNAQYVALTLDASIITLKKKIPFNGGGTNFSTIFKRANKKYDNIIILSDMQGWMEVNLQRTYKEYKTKFNANPKLYSFDLNNYGTSMFPEKNVYCLAGFSEKAFDLMKLLETDQNAMIHEIEKVEI